MAAKTARKWVFETVQSRLVAAHLDKVSAEGRKVFGVYISATSMGSLDILTYHDEKAGEAKASAPSPAVPPVKAEGAKGTAIGFKGTVDAKAQ